MLGIKVRNKYVVNQVRVLWALARVTNLHKTFELSPAIANISAYYLDGCGRDEIIAARIDEHLHYFVAGRKRPGRAYCNICIGLVVLRLVKAANAIPDLRNDVYRPNSGRNAAIVRQDRNGRVDRPILRQVALHLDPT
jgi:hypothetical protein